MFNTPRPNPFHRHIPDHMTNTVGEATIEGRIIPVGRGGEAIVFEIPMGFFKIVAIANIPEEGKDSAPVYLKLKVGDFAMRRVHMDSRRRRTPGGQQNDAGETVASADPIPEGEEEFYDDESGEPS